MDEYSMHFSAFTVQITLTTVSIFAAAYWWASTKRTGSASNLANAAAAAWSAAAALIVPIAGISDLGDEFRWAFEGAASIAICGSLIASYEAGFPISRRLVFSAVCIGIVLAGIDVIWNDHSSPHAKRMTPAAEPLVAPDLQKTSSKN